MDKPIIHVKHKLKLVLKFFNLWDRTVITGRHELIMIQTEKPKTNDIENFKTFEPKHKLLKDYVAACSHFQAKCEARD